MTWNEDKRECMCKYCSEVQFCFNINGIPEECENCTDKECTMNISVKGGK